jgi:hypothetical protein
MADLKYHSLVSFMAFLSRKYLRTEWDENLSYFLWDCLQNSHTLEPYESFNLTDLSERLEVWAVWNYDTKSVELVSLYDWAIQYEEDMADE